MCQGKHSAIQLIKNSSPSSKLQLPQASFSISKSHRQCISCVPRKTICNAIDKQNSHKLTIPSLQARGFHHKHTHTAHHAILGKQSAIHLIKNISTRAKCQLPQAGLSITKKIRQCTPCVPRRTFCNPIDQQYLHTLKISI